MIGPGSRVPPADGVPCPPFASVEKRKWALCAHLGLFLFESSKMRQHFPLLLLKFRYGDEVTGALSFPLRKRFTSFHEKKALVDGGKRYFERQCAR